MASTVVAIHTTIPMATTECFSIEAEKYKHGISLNYEVLRGVAESLEVELINEQGAVLYSNKGTNGRFLGPVEQGGMHNACFRNIIDAVGDVVVGFSFHADDPTHEVLSNADATKIKQAQDMEDLVYELTSTLDTVKDTQSYMKSIKNYHIQVIESTHNRILWWTCVEAVVLFVVAFWQISYLRRALEAVEALRARRMLAALTNQDVGSLLDKLVANATANRPAVYCGFDPTADSLHLGNLLQGIALRHFQVAGVRPILVVGGATGMVGDPSGKSDERSLLSPETVEHNARQIIHGLSPVLDFDCPRTGAIIVNNADWHAKMSAVDWLRDIGRHFRVNTMLTRESVKKRLDTDQGISFLEFSYQLFQAYDFLHLYRQHNCVAQLGGSDQWGNIASGCDLIRKATGNEAYGITLSLLTTAAGEKYGKSAGNAIWLDAKKTQVFDFFQYFLRADDRDVEQLLMSFTFLDLTEIREIVEEHSRAPEKRAAQKTLAESITRTMHGEDALRSAQGATEALFGKGTLTADQVLSMAGDAPMAFVPRSELVGKSLVDVAVSIGTWKSKAEGRRLIKGGGVYLNNIRVDHETKILGADDLLDGKLLLLRIGRRKNHIVQAQD
ncbi:TPA: hypothetical protein N0F65_011570 [Lagenidium giganteum]|uniref:Tyrosine--tRNA ligase n=1 Tax=Lagenidium giganteum TaxID=4803 RepID=A0AAV2YQ37_9STRA|nr:TPA: hypothetical protein N0F65_011570 [Lagenidium giganteum]